MSWFISTKVNLVLILALLRRDQVNLLVYGLDLPYFKKRQKNNNFDQLAFSVLLFSAF